MSTETTLQHHLDAFDARDVDEIMQDYVASSVLITEDGVARGLAEIRAQFEVFFAEAMPGGVALDERSRVIEGEVAYVVWTAETEHLHFELGTDTFVIRDEKIVYQTVAASVKPKVSDT